MDPGICINSLPDLPHEIRRQEDPVKYRRLVFIISILDFLIGFLMLSIWSFRSFPFSLMDDTLVDHFGVLAVIWLFLLYSLQVIMAMILCGGTQRVSAERSGLKFNRWFKASFLIIVMLFLNNLLFFSAEGFEFQSLSAYIVNLAQLIFRIFAMAFLATSNRKLMFGPYALRLHDRIISRNLGEMGGVDPSCQGQLMIFPPPPPYDDFPPTYEEATDPKIYHSSKINPLT